MKIALISFLTLIGILLLGFLGDAVGLFNIKFWGVKYENAHRQVFEQTQSYVEGKRQDITKYRLEYLESKDPTTKQAIRMTIIQDVANMTDLSVLGPDLESFVLQLRAE